MSSIEAASPAQVERAADEVQSALEGLRQAVELLRAEPAGTMKKLKSLLQQAEESQAEERRQLQRERVLREHELKVALEALREATRLVRASARPRVSLWEKVRGMPRVLRRPVKFEAVPRGHVEPAKVEGFNWTSTGSDPCFDLIPRGRFPSGWVLLDLELRGAKGFPFLPSLYFDVGTGFSEDASIMLPSPTEGRLRAVMKLPEHVRALRFDPSDRPGNFALGELTIVELTRPGAAARLSQPIVARLAQDPRLARDLWHDTQRRWRQTGFRSLKEQLKQLIPADRKSQGYAAWVARYDSLRDWDRELISERIPALPLQPLISVVMQVDGASPRWLGGAIDSVRAQLYENWELCIATDATTAPQVEAMLEDAAKNDPRIKLASRQTGEAPLSLAAGERVVFLGPDDVLAEHALYLVVEAINAEPEVELLYSDEDSIDQWGVRHAPHFKPEWNPELFYSQNFVAHLGVYRRALLVEVAGQNGGADAVLPYLAKTQPARIRRIPHVLYHRRAHPGAAPEVSEAGTQQLNAHFAQLGSSLTAAPGKYPGTFRLGATLPADPPLVSILIPTRDGLQILKQCIDSIYAKTTYPKFEILIVDNQSQDPQTLAYLKRLEAKGQARILRFNHPFNYPAINNFAASEAKGEVLALLNNDIEVISPQWLEELVSHALRPEIGAVGAKLYYPNDTIQHAGVITGLGGVAAHSHKHFPRGATGHCLRPNLTQAISAVTAACLVIRTSTWNQVGGMDRKNLAVAFNDVDFCLRVKEAGYRNLFTPYAELYHHESVSRGAEDTPKKKARFEREIQYMHRRWETAAREDPYYSPNLSLGSEDFSIAWPPRAPKPWVVDQVTD